jgi:hypothetical protein
VRIRPEIIARIRSATSAAELRAELQHAVELEHATIPVYLTALFSIKPGANPEAAGVLRSIVNEEMLHMTIASNVLNAIGGAPVIDHPGFIPVFPGPLPMGIGGLTVGLERLTRGQVYSTFMAIEEPEAPISFVVRQPRMAAFAALHAPAEEYATIGQFYAALMAQLRTLGPSIFTGDPARQVVDNTWFPADQLFAIRTVDDAVRGLTVIVEQGEGTRREPTDPDHELAHYYRFAEIVYGRRLVRDPRDPQGWSYSGAPVGLDPGGVWPLYANAKSVDYPAGSQVRAISDQFNASYTSLLGALQRTFDGAPGDLARSLGVMFELRLLANKLVATPVPNTSYTGAPTFEYAPIPR